MVDLNKRSRRRNTVLGVVVAGLLIIVACMLLVAVIARVSSALVSWSYENTSSTASMAAPGYSDSFIYIDVLQIGEGESVWDEIRRKSPLDDPAHVAWVVDRLETELGKDLSLVHPGAVIKYGMLDGDDPYVIMYVATPSSAL